MKKFLVGGLILSFGFISCLTGAADNESIDTPKIVEKKYRGRFENAAFSGNWYIITENTISWLVRLGYSETYTYPAYTTGADLYKTRHDGGSPQKQGTFINENTLVTNPDSISPTTYERVTE